jgi:hypothetical protein
VREWIEEHRDELEANWERAASYQRPEAGGVFAPIHEQREIFEQVHVNPESRTVEWPGEVDLDPEVLYGRYEPASGHRIQRRTIRGPVTAAA